MICYLSANRCRDQSFDNSVLTLMRQVHARPNDLSKLNTMKHQVVAVSMEQYPIQCNFSGLAS